MTMWFSYCKRILGHIFRLLGIFLVVGVLGTFAMIYSGVFNVAATVVNAAPLSWLLVTVREASIGRNARDIQAPALTDAANRDNGFRIYRESCAMCHTPVGRTATPMAVGFNPQPPTFGKDADDMTAGELFWVAKNGIRFTAMPAWGPSRSDKELWDVVEFLMTLQKMSAADYDAIDRRIPPEPPTQ